MDRFVKCATTDQLSNPFYHTIGLPTSIRPNFPLCCRFLCWFCISAFKHTYARICMHSLPLIHSLSNPADSVGLTTEQLICQNSIIDFICSMWFSPFIFHQTCRQWDGERESLWEYPIHSFIYAFGQLLFRLIHLILCFGIFGSLHFQAVNSQLKS